MRTNCTVGGVGRVGVVTKECSHSMEYTHKHYAPCAYIMNEPDIYELISDQITARFSRMPLSLLLLISKLELLVMG
jgi:hypothetical protein